MGKVTVFSLDTCPHCKRAKELLTKKGVEFQEISLTKNPEWRARMFLLANGNFSTSSQAVCSSFGPDSRAPTERPGEAWG